MDSRLTTHTSTSSLNFITYFEIKVGQTYLDIFKTETVTDSSHRISRLATAKPHGLMEPYTRRNVRLIMNFSEHKTFHFIHFIYIFKICKKWTAKIRNKNRPTKHQYFYINELLKTCIPIIKLHNHNNNINNHIST